MIHRADELEILDRSFNQPSSSIDAVIGAHSIGKTTLINNHISQKQHLYLSCIELTPYLLYRNIFKQVQQYFATRKNININSFSDILEFISQQKIDQKLILVIDDFQNLQKIDKNILHEIYRVWHKSLKFKNIQLILSVSVYSSDSFYKKVLNKFDHIIYLKPFSYKNTSLSLPNILPNDEMYLFASFGTNPKYLKYYDANKDFISNLKEHIFNPDSVLFGEGITLLKKDFSEVGTYCSILYAISIGYTKIGDIAIFMDLKSTYLTRYLQKLIDYMYITKIVPVNEDIDHSKFGRYKINDNFIKFWFCYVYPNYSTLQVGNIQPVVDNFRRTFSKLLVRETYKETIYEMISNDPEKFLGYKPSKIGYWWNNKNKMIDIVAYNSEQVTFVECQWRQKDSAQITYEKLKYKSNEFKTVLKKSYIVFAKNKPIDKK